MALSRFDCLELESKPVQQWVPVLRCPVAGAGYVPGIVSHIQSVGADFELYLVREPWNPYDAQAIVVLNREGQKLGYIPRYCNQDLALKMDQGEPVQAVCLALDDTRAEWPEIHLEVSVYQLLAQKCRSDAILKANRQ